MRHVAGLDKVESQERSSVDDELRCKKIARECGERCLPTHTLEWADLFESATPPGAMTVVVARETLTRQANRRRWDRQKQLRSGASGLLASLAA